MRKFVGMLAVVALVATPAMADLSGSSYTPTLATGLVANPGQSTVGVYGGPGIIYTDFKVVAEPSDIIHLTFAFHWPYTTPVYGVQAQYQFVWDNSEVEILGMTPAGTFAGGWFNYPSSATWWEGPSAGTLAVGDVLGTGIPLVVNPAVQTITTYYSGTIVTSLHVFAGSEVAPFFQIDLHVKDVISDSFMDVLVGQFALLFKFTAFSAGTWWTGGALGAVSYGMGVVPEPASLALLGLGMASVGVGAWRRRRR